MSARDLLVLALVGHVRFLTELGCPDKRDIKRLCCMIEDAVLGEPLRPEETDRMQEGCNE